jgi:hypothetical protein
LSSVVDVAILKDKCIEGIFSNQNGHINMIANWKIGKTSIMP